MKEFTMTRSLVLALCACLLSLNAVQAQTREEKVRNDKKRVEAEGFWIYNDLPKAYSEAKRTGKPILVVLRCLPCEECVKLDDELIEQDAHVKPLLQKFVCARVVSTNGLDLSIFQFDTDQSFAVFFLNAEGDIYGRFGTRSDQIKWADDVSIEGLARAMEGALELHAQYPRIKAGIAGKKGPAPDFTAPENYPLLKGKYGSRLNYEGNVVQSCIHCHQIGDAQREWYRREKTTIPDKVLFPYPHPKALGLILDPKERATIREVLPESPAAEAGFKAGDRIRTLEGQPLLSIADLQWVFHHTPPEGATLKASVERAGQTRELSLKLTSGWRQRDDISWRASSWGLRRMGFGGMLLKEMSDEERAALKLPRESLSLKIAHVGQYSPHDVAKRAGFLKDDVLISFNNRSDLRRESDLLAYALNELKPGDSIPVTILRKGERRTLTLPIPR
jgi:hypothetical protein